MKQLLHVALFLLLTTTPSFAELEIGQSRDEVLELLGQPEAQVQKRGREILHYGESTVELAHGVLVAFDPEVEKDARQPRQTVNQPTFTPPAKSNGNNQAPPAIQIGKAPSSQPPVKKISEKGRKIEVSELIVPGKITVVDFYADWCGPCRRISPKLETLAQQDAEVYLRKVDIINWKTPVVQQYKLRSIPHVRVYDRSGKQIGPGTSNLKLINQYVQQAK